MNDSDKDGLIDFIRMTRMLFHYEYLESRDRLKLNFELVTAAQDDNETLVNVTEAQLSPSEFHSLSVDFVTERVGGSDGGEFHVQLALRHRVG